VSFDATTLKRMAAAQPSEFPPMEEIWTSRATSGNRKLTFDPGPGRDLAKLMKTTLPRDPAFIKKFEINGDFGHYRGTFKDPKVVIIADPSGDDDLITSRALTGSRGQYLHTLLKSMGVEDRYLVIKTAPFSNYSDANQNSSGSQAWNQIIDATKTYREELLKKVFSTTSPSLILVDGQWAQAEFKRLFPSCPLAVQGSCPVIEINRKGPEPESGISDAVAGIKAIAGFSNADFNGKMTDIPRSHLTYYARVWEGTSGDRVITSNDPRYIGKAWAQVAPRWAYNQKFSMTTSDLEGCVKLIQKQVDQKTRLGEEKVSKFYTRVASGQPYDADAHCRRVANGAMNGLDGSAGGSGTVDENFKDLPNDHTIDPSEISLWEK
jgi:hypothetical protein